MSQFCIQAQATTLSELGAVTAISNQLQGHASTKLAPIVNQVQQQVANYKQINQNKFSENSDYNNYENSDNYKKSTSSYEGSPESSRDTYQEKQAQSNIKNIDYNKGLQVFYKKSCKAGEKKCHRGAVLTNINSVIFDYAKARGRFADLKNKRSLASETSASQ